MNLLVGNRCEIGFLREVLAKQPIRIFIGAAFPSGIRMGEIELELESFSDLFMLGKLLAMIGSHSVDLVLDGQEERANLRLNCLSRSLFHLGNQHETGLAFSESDYDILMFRTKHCIQFPVAQALSGVHKGWTLFNRTTIG